MSFFAREAWDEFRFGLRNGVIPMIYLVLVGYLLLVAGNADYLRDMGAVGIPRNAPSLVYIMTSGDAFFLLFAWAWIFAQPIIRDRSARLHEVVLAAPVPLRRLLAARYCGALGVVLVVGSSQIVGFLVAPLLEWIGAVPPVLSPPRPGRPSPGLHCFLRCRCRRGPAPCTSSPPCAPAAWGAHSRSRHC
jgi:hypothetical protein